MELSSHTTSVYWPVMSFRLFSIVRIELTNYTGIPTHLLSILSFISLTAICESSGTQSSDCDVFFRLLPRVATFAFPFITAVFWYLWVDGTTISGWDSSSNVIIAISRSPLAPAKAFSISNEHRAGNISDNRSMTDEVSGVNSEIDDVLLGDSASSMPSESSFSVDCDVSVLTWSKNEIIKYKCTDHRLELSGTGTFSLFCPGIWHPFSKQVS